MKKKEIFFWTITVILLLVFLLTVLEVFARHKQYEMWTRIDNFKHVPILTLPLKQLGWVNKPGSYRYSVTNDANNFISVTVNPDGSRGKVTELPSEKPEIWFFGCSFTYGFGVADGQEFPAIIQESFPNYRFRNFGAPGYSTLQCLQMYYLQRKIQKTVPVLVVYGLVYTHGSRNVANNWWLKSCLRARGQNNWAEVPYARYEDKTWTKLQVYAPKKYAKWPLSEHFAFINFIQDQIDSAGDLELDRQSAQVTLHLLKIWELDIKKAGSKFLVFNLWDPNDPMIFSEGLRKNGLELLNAGSIPYPAKETSVPVDGHPNQIIHGIWARVFSDYLRNAFPGIG